MSQKKQFYSHIVDTDSLLIELDKMELSGSEKEHLIAIVESSIHHAVLDAILSELSESDKKLFIEHLVSNSHDKIWDHLRSRVENIEERIKKAAEDLKDELHKDIKELRENNPH